MVLSGIASCALKLWLCPQKALHRSGRAAQVGHEREQFDPARERGHYEAVVPDHLFAGIV